MLILEYFVTCLVIDEETISADFSFANHLREYLSFWRHIFCNKEGNRIVSPFPKNFPQNLWYHVGQHYHTLHVCCWYAQYMISSFPYIIVGTISHLELPDMFLQTKFDTWWCHLNKSLFTGFPQPVNRRLDSSSSCCCCYQVAETV